MPTKLSSFQIGVIKLHMNPGETISQTIARLQSNPSERVPYTEKLARQAAQQAAQPATIRKLRWTILRNKIRAKRADRAV